MPELKSDYKHAWWLPGAHLPTLWGKKGRAQPAMHERIERWPTPDDDHLSIARAGNITSGQPHLLVLHGLEGSVNSNYAQGLMAQAIRRGWSADLMLFRACDGSINSQRRMYHSGETTDVDFVVRKLLESHPDIDLRLVGVSLGGNVLMKWLGEQGESLVPNVTRAAGVSVPYDLAAGSRFLESGLGPRYVSFFMKSLKAKTVAKRDMYPDLCDWDRLMKASTFWEFDDAVTGPVHGFTGAADYYSRSSSINYLGRIRRPTLLFAAVDDPFVPSSVLNDVRKLAASNEFLHFEFTRNGGHVGWTSGQPWAPRYYMEERVIAWLADTHQRAE
jgi:predicted alpha/beta-fold hydrolase